MSKQQAWSYSSLTAYETCPWRYYLTKVAKTVVEPQTDATLWGNRVHKAFEHRIGDGLPFTDELSHYEPIAQTILTRAKGKTVATEQKIALNNSFREVKYFDKSVWLRAVLDLSIERGTKATIIDYKTGKKVHDTQQLQLSAAVYFATRPWIDEITNVFIWLKTGEISKEKFVKEDAPGIWNEFIPRVNRLQQSIDLDKFPKRPSGLCRAWCPVGKAKCEHCGE